MNLFFVFFVLFCFVLVRKSNHMKVAKRVGGVLVSEQLLSVSIFSVLVRKSYHMKVAKRVGVLVSQQWLFQYIGLLSEYLCIHCHITICIHTHTHMYP